MKPVKHNKLFSKLGSTLVEVVVAVTVLAIMVVTVVSGICMAQRSVTDYNGQDSYTAQAHSITDALVNYLSNWKDSKPVDSDLQLALESGLTLKCVNTSDWLPVDKNGKQFKYVWDDTDPNAPGFRIEVRVYYDGGKKYAGMTAYAANTGGAFKK